MLRSSRYLKSSLEKSISTSSASLSRRSFNYQKQIYLKNYENAVNIEDRAFVDDVVKSRQSFSNLYRYINAYHKYGYQSARLDPLELENPRLHTLKNYLDPKEYGLDSSEKFKVDNLLFNTNSNQLDLAEIEKYLKSHYSSNCAIEFDYLKNEEEKLWINKEFELLASYTINKEVKLDLLKLLLKSQVEN